MSEDKITPNGDSEKSSDEAKDLNNNKVIEETTIPQKNSKKSKSKSKKVTDVSKETLPEHINNNEQDNDSDILPNSVVSEEGLHTDALDDSVVSEEGLHTGTLDDSVVSEEGLQAVSFNDSIISEDGLHTDAFSRPEDKNAEIEAAAVLPEEGQSDAEPVASKKSGIKIYQIIRILCMIGFFVFTGLFINEVIIQPYRIKKSIELTRELYNKPTQSPTATVAPTKPPVTAVVSVTPTPAVTVEATPTPDPTRDTQGRLLQFKDLLAVNDDVKGWLTIPDTNVDYVVMQSGADKPDYYLDKDINLDYSKAGTLYLDYKASIENNSKNFVIYGHNMVSTAEKMFHFLLDYKKVSYYKAHPLITFDTIYNTGTWKIFAVFKTTPDAEQEDFFDYRKSTFLDSSDFLNFVYQVRIRSLLNIDTVDINENDQLLMLSTCSYEVNNNYRTVIVARKVRDGEDPAVDTESVTKNEAPLFAQDYYDAKGGEAPELAATFEDALANGEINWYTPPADNTSE